MMWFFDPDIGFHQGFWVWAGYAQLELPGLPQFY
jgi:hypothetical protein